MTSAGTSRSPNAAGKTRQHQNRHDASASRSPSVGTNERTERMAQRRIQRLRQKQRERQNLVLGCLVALVVTVVVVVGWWRHRSTQTVYPGIDTSYPIRIASPTNDESGGRQEALSSKILHTYYSPQERADFMEKYGNQCWAGATDRYVHLGIEAPMLQLELWKSCLLYLKVANVYWKTDEVRFTLDEVTMLEKQRPDKTVLIVTTTKSNGDSSNKNRRRKNSTGSIVPDKKIHPSFLRVGTSGSAYPVLKEGCRMLVETPLKTIQRTSTPASAVAPSSLLSTMSKALHALFILSDPTVWKLTCNTDSWVETCPLPNGFCCQASETHKTKAETNTKGVDKTNTSAEVPIIVAMVRHPLVPSPLSVQSPTTTAESISASSSSTPSVKSTITVRHTNVFKPTLQQTPNLFDILLQNDCLPTQKACHKCLKKFNECGPCVDSCGCYCKALCRIRPPPKALTQVWTVQAPIHQLNTDRLIPKIIHQVSCALQQ